MVAFDVFDLLDRFGPGSYIGLEDFTDKLSFMYSVMLLLISTIVVSLKSYVLTSISCYMSTFPSNGNFESYLENYCWVHGTVPIYNRLLPEKQYAWKELKKERGLLYYQWVPFVLGLQTMLFFVPRFVWQLFCMHGGGIDLDKIMKQSVEISDRAYSEREDEYKSLASVLTNTLYLHRDFRSGRRAELRRTISDKFACLLPSKRLGTNLILSYLMIKFLYFINAILQLFLIQKFLGFHGSFLSFPGKLFSHMMSGIDWEVENLFPRTTFCNVPHIKQVGAQNSYTAQCVLPVNMLNEKVYIFLFFWILLVCVLTLLSFPIWIWRMFRDNSRSALVRKYLKMHSAYRESSRPRIDKFTKEFLRHDGLFVVIMIKMNAGDVVASHITHELWKQYTENYANVDMRHDPKFIVDRQSLAINLENEEDNTKFRDESTEKHVKQPRSQIYNDSIKPAYPPPEYL